MRFLFASFLILSAAGMTAQQTSAKPPSSSHQAAHQKPTDNAVPPTSPGAGNGADKTGTDKHDQIGITTVPEINIKRDRFDCIYLLLNVLLVLIGGLTFAAIWYQAKKTADATIAMQGQVTEMGRQREVMFLQLRAIHEQVSEISAQTNVLERSVSIAEKHLTLIINKERPWISVPPPDNLELKEGLFSSVGYKLNVFAPTPAIIVAAEMNVGVEITNNPDLRWTHSMNVTSIDTRTSTVINKNSPLMVSVNDAFRQEVYEKRKFIHFYGFVKYTDVFQVEGEKPHETTFSYLWMVGSDVIGGFPKIGEGRWLSGWEEHPPGANKET